MDFLARRLPKLLEDVRIRLATFLRADPDGLVAVPNATTGVATVLHAIPWEPGDEILLADSAYNAVKQAARAVCDRWGARVVEARVPFPISDPAEVTAAFAAAISPRTRLVIVDHVVSATAVVFPAADVVKLAKERGVPVLVDGAHAPGMLPLDIGAIGADFYTGNLHKWVCTPKGTAILHLGPAWRDRVHPLVVSHGYRGGMRAEFDWTGTADPSGWLAVPEALAFFDEIGWDRTRAYQHALVRDARVRIAEALEVDLPHPDDPRLYAALATIPVPWARPDQLFSLTAKLHAEHRIEAPFTSYDDRAWIRVSGQLYNHPDQYARLAEILRTFRG